MAYLEDPAAAESPMPDLYLHPWHLQDLVRPQAVSWGQLAPAPLHVLMQVFGQTSRPLDPSRGLEAADLPHLCTLPRLRVQANRGVHVLLCTADSEVLFPPLLLLLANIHMCHDAEYGLPLLAVTADTEASTKPNVEAFGWLVLVGGGAVAGRRALYHLGRAGAIRHDFTEEFSLAGGFLGKGSQAATYRLQPCRESLIEHAALAAKVPLPDAETSDAVSEAVLPPNVCTEVRMLTAVAGHPHIVQFFGLFFGEGGRGRPEESESRGPAWAIVMGLCSGGDLFDQVTTNPLTEFRAKRIIWGLLAALTHIHSRGIIHRDVKPENVLLANRGWAVLADFGIACREEDESEVVRRCGTPGYTAPEVLRGKAYGHKVDMFSTGVTLFFILSQTTPFRGSCTRSTLKRTLKCEVCFDGIPYFDAVSFECRNVILQLLAKDCRDRISATEAQAHAWFHVDLCSSFTQSSRTLSEVASSARTLAEVAGSARRPRPISHPKSMQPGELHGQHSSGRRYSLACFRRCSTVSRFSLSSSFFGSTGAFSAFSSSARFSGSTGGDLPPYPEDGNVPTGSTRSIPVDYALGMSLMGSLSRGPESRVMSLDSSMQAQQSGDVLHTYPEKPPIAEESPDKDGIVTPRQEDSFDAKHGQNGEGQEFSHTASGSQSSERRSVGNSVSVRLGSRAFFRSAPPEGHPRSTTPLTPQGHPRSTTPLTPQGARSAYHLGRMHRFARFIGLRTRRRKFSSPSTPSSMVSTMSWRSIFTSPVHGPT